MKASESMLESESDQMEERAKEVQTRRKGNLESNPNTFPKR